MIHVPTLQERLSRVGEALIAAAHALGDATNELARVQRLLDVEDPDAVKP